MALAGELPGGDHRVPRPTWPSRGSEKLAAKAGRRRHLVANAGLPGTGRLDDFPARRADGALRVNLEAPIMIARALWSRLLRGGRGPHRLHRLARGQVAVADASVYNATKFGLRGFALGLRKDLAHGAGVSIVSPGSSAKRAMTPRRPRRRSPPSSRSSRRGASTRR